MRSTPQRPRPARRWTTVLAVLCVGISGCSSTAAPSSTGPSSTGSSSTETAGSSPSRSDSSSSGGPSAESTDGGGAQAADVLGLSDTTDEALPDSIDRLSGSLDNGLAYVVKHNERPGKKVSLRLAIKAGSANELSDRTGVAHFLEHMLFNGTDEYPKNELVDVLKGFGADFGADINAYTGYEETVYELSVPNDDESVATALDVLHQWLTSATIAEPDVAAERGVVLDEWRTRTQTSEGRLLKVSETMYLAGSPFQGREPIGTKSDIESMDAASVRDFYDAWYRPNNASVVVVGDVDPKAIEQQIDKIFRDTAARGDATSDVDDYEFPLMTDTACVLHADPEQKSVDVEVTLPMPAVPGVGTLSERANLYDRVIFNIMIRRLERDIASGDAPFTEIGRGTNSLVPQLDAPALYARTDAAGASDTLGVLLDEYARTAQFGFTTDEVDAAKVEIRAQVQSLVAPGDERQDDDYADTFVQRFLTGESATRLADLDRWLGNEVDAITGTGLAQRFEARWANSAPHVIVSVPTSAQAQIPSEAELCDLVDAASGREIAERATADPLPDTLMATPPPVEPKSTQSLSGKSPQFAPVLYTYENGARVVLVPNTISEGTVTLSAVSPGGLSVVADDDVIDAKYAAEIVTKSGIADFNAPDFEQISASGAASVQPDIGTYQDRFVGSSTTDSTELMLQMVHLYVTAPRFDSVALKQVVTEYQPVVDDPAVDPAAAQADKMSELRYGNQIRLNALPTPEEFATLDLDGVGRTWRQLMGEASDWLFVLAGDLPPDAATLTNSYLGTLPGDGTVDQPIDFSEPMPAGVTDEHVNAGSGDTGSVLIRVSTPVDAIASSLDVQTDLATAVISARLTKVLREEFGDTYSPSAFVWMDQDPDPTIEAGVLVSGSPDRLDDIEAAIVAELADLAEGGLTDDEYRTAIQPTIENYAFVSNELFVSQVELALTVPNYSIDSFVDRASVAKQFGASDVASFIGKYVPADRYISVSVSPDSSPSG